MSADVIRVGVFGIVKRGGQVDQYWDVRRACILINRSVVDAVGRWRRVDRDRDDAGIALAWRAIVRGRHLQLI